MLVRDIMTTPVVTVRPETPLKEVARLLVEHRISGVPVVDDEGRVVGVVSEADFLAREAGEAKPARHSLWWFVHPSGSRRSTRLQATVAGEAMTTPAVTIGPDRPLAEAAALMIHRNVNRLPVVKGGRLIGILTRADIVRAFARTDEELYDVVRDSVRAVDGLRVVAVRNGVVTLAGTVRHEALARTARSLVERIDGVVAVDDHELAWEPEEPRPEPWVDVGSAGLRG
jgi:CBS domain-containing protein